MKKRISLLPLTVLASCYLFACQKPGESGKTPTPTPQVPKKETPEVVTRQISVVLPKIDTPKLPKETLIPDMQPALFFDAIRTDKNIVIEGTKEYTVKLVADKPVAENTSFSLQELPSFAKLLSQTYQGYKALPISNVAFPASVVIPKGKNEAEVKIGLKTDPAFITAEDQVRGFVTVLDLKSNTKSALFSGKNQNLIGVLVGLTVNESSPKKPETGGGAEKTPKQPEAKNPAPKEPEKANPGKKDPKSNPPATDKKPENNTPAPKPSPSPKPAPGTPAVPSPGPSHPAVPTPGRPSTPTPGHPVPPADNKIVATLSMPASAQAIIQKEAYDLPFSDKETQKTYYIQLNLNKAVTKTTTFTISVDETALREHKNMYPTSGISFPGRLTFQTGKNSGSITIKLKDEDPYKLLFLNPLRVQQLVSILKVTCDDQNVVFNGGHNTIGIVLKYKDTQSYLFEVYHRDIPEWTKPLDTVKRVNFEVITDQNHEKNSQRDGRDGHGTWKNNPANIYDRRHNTVWWVDSNSENYLKITLKKDNGDIGFYNVKGLRFDLAKPMASVNIQISTDSRNFIDLGNVNTPNEGAIFLRFKHPINICAIKIGNFVHQTNNGNRGAFVDIDELYIYK